MIYTQRIEALQAEIERLGGQQEEWPNGLNLVFELALGFPTKALKSGRIFQCYQSQNGLTT